MLIIAALVSNHLKHQKMTDEMQGLNFHKLENNEKIRTLTNEKHS